MKFIFVLIFSLIPILSIAQIGSRASATVSGQVIDNSDNSPMGAATISVMDKETGSVLTGAISDAKGKFQIPDVPFGVYDINISFLGYNTVKLDSISITGDQPEFSIGTITLSSADVTPGEVEVVGEKPVVENKFDKIIYNVSNDVTSQGALAIDVLRKVPQVTVDADGNVELQGNSNIRFLINGKESSIFGNNLADALQSIPASQIKSIEAITNPGAKYDLQGTAGIINIILQESRLKGIDGNVNLTVGTRNQNGSVNLGVKRGNFGVNGYFSGNWRLGTDGDFSSSRVSTDTSSMQNTTLIQNGINRFERKGYRAGAGFEWEIAKKLNLTGSAGYNNFTFGSSGPVDLNETITNISGGLISEYSTIRDFTNNRQNSSIDWNINLKKGFRKEGHEIDLVVNSTYGRPVSDYFLTLSRAGDANPSQGIQSKNPGTDNTTTFQVDYVYPVSETSEIEAGLKSSFNEITSSVGVNVYNPLSGEYVFDPVQSYNLKYSLDIYAAYLSASFRLFNWLDFKPGARYEYSDIGIDYPGASVPSYGTLVPSLLLSHNLGKNKSVQLTYTRRIRRPGYNDLNPFINRSDPFNVETGNYLLRPEVGERFELSYNTGFSKGGNLKITLAQRISSREIEDITTFYPFYTIGDSTFRNVSVRTKDNIGSEYNTGLNIFGSIPITSKLNLRTNMGLFHNYLVTNRSEGSLSTGFAFRGNLNASWQLPDKFLAELFGFWRSGERTIQGRDPQFYIYNFAIRKLFWKDNASLGFTVTNVFRKSIRQVSTVTTENSVSRSVRELPFRSFGLSFTYKFGKIQPQQNRENEGEGFGGSTDQ
jgi:outer membrane receptor protein involved in Fe transport